MTAVAVKPARVLPVLALLALGAGRALAFLGAACPNSALRRRDGGAITTLVRPSNVPNCQSAGGVADALPSQRPPSTTEREEEMLPAQSKGSATVAWVQLMLDSFEDTFGRGIIDGLDREKLSPEEQEREIDRSDVPIISHDFLRNAEDPIFIYGTSLCVCAGCSTRSRSCGNVCGTVLALCSRVRAGLALFRSTRAGDRGCEL